jgi:hypothetical protein
MTLLNVQDAILAQLNTLTQDVYDGVVPEDTKLKFDASGNLLPYIVVEHAGITAMDIGAPITGVADASGESSVSVLCIGPTQRSSRQVAALVREKLTGFQPTGSGQLKPISSPYTYISGNANPTRYISEIVFSFALNTVW